MCQSLKKNKNNSEVFKFNISSDIEEPANQPKKLSKLRKMLKSKKLSKNRKLLRFNTKKDGPRFLTPNAKTSLNCL